MSLTAAFQMDPVSGVDIDADSTFALALEAQKRGHAMFHYPPRALTLREGRVTARGEAMTVRREAGNHAALGAPETVDLADMDVVLMRQDPPFDMAYITATHVLDLIHPETLVVNDPAHVRNAPEKILIAQFPDLIPPTLISADADEIKSFRAEHKDIVIKPLFGNGGAGVFHVSPENENFNTILEMFFERSREPVMVQPYLPEVRRGDKRIILIDGAAAGAVNRVPPEGDARANMHTGARAEKAALNRRDEEICEALGPVLKERGLIFTGIDVIGNWLTEINVTSPTGVQEIARFDGTDPAARIWDAIEARL
ncbi:MAG: glutathione synthase [Rhodospirillales bacterium]